MIMIMIMNRKGFFYAYVLCLVLILSIIVVGIQMRAHNFAQNFRLRLFIAQARHAAEGGLAIASRVASGVPSISPPGVLPTVGSLTINFPLGLESPIASVTFGYSREAALPNIATGTGEVRDRNGVLVGKYVVSDWVAVGTRRFNTTGGIRTWQIP